MIDPKTLTLKDVGRKVVWGAGHINQEECVLTSWNDSFVFVRFRGPNGESCLPEDIEFVSDGWIENQSVPKQ